ncbi:hypothetical protein ASG43_03195 [Aureimonas sp. Leaf454]|uniref:hypothetical protein n=1 Tax=Aureimonas sp. Leaf454 TaxID=1736381 RepID=UPI00070234B6|nr:hypothetical protein [Aureimonas sp. Leaf454]KQT54605.1 hypothetical protein ASG43_03195 [Aureimonas sp. Leaf454]
MSASPAISRDMTPAARQAAELALIPTLLLRVADGFPPATRSTSKVRATIAHLRAATAAAWVGLGSSDLMDASLCLSWQVDDMARGARFTDRLGLVAYHLAKVLTEAEVIVIGEGSPLDRALHVMLPALEPAAQNDALDEAAQKQAVRALRTAQRAGLFPDLSIKVAST